MSRLASRPMNPLLSVGCSWWVAPTTSACCQPAVRRSAPTRHMHATIPRGTVPEHAAYRYSGRETSRSSLPPSFAQSASPDQAHVHGGEAAQLNRTDADVTAHRARMAVQRQSRQAGSGDMHTGRGATVTAPAPESASVPQPSVSAFETSPGPTPEREISPEDAASKAGTMARQAEGTACSSLSPSSPSAPRSQQASSSSQPQSVQAEGPAASVPIEPASGETATPSKMKAAPRKGTQLKAQKAAISLVSSKVFFDLRTLVS
ncbi:hypothetical protein IE81DRAFT_217560 [Ceraceosorus guamensis]|uniref:Uncharacterized protein n=1 Tax=Ceraceosorus guamensis TaxID=1522189 RepID=A0A316VSG9_9BASI|nr:hypothetical protein IE81DRAFT_217560 [Ceraceosorus guamensis]PWN40579.1 hypothetical protein IE81DRAFT_217560 [Ceraceosorus guamensis]